MLEVDDQPAVHFATATGPVIYTVGRTSLGPYVSDPFYVMAPAAPWPILMGSVLTAIRKARLRTMVVGLPDEDSLYQQTFSAEEWEALEASGVAALSESAEVLPTTVIMRDGEGPLRLGMTVAAASALALP
jgi:hypothetical protein